MFESPRQLPTPKDDMKPSIYDIVTGPGTPDWVKPVLVAHHKECGNRPMLTFYGRDLRAYAVCLGCQAWLEFSLIGSAGSRAIACDVTMDVNAPQ